MSFKESTPKGRQVYPPIENTGVPKMPSPSVITANSSCGEVLILFITSPVGKWVSGNQYKVC